MANRNIVRTLAIFAACFVAGSSAILAPIESGPSPVADNAWEHFKAEFRKTYQNAEHELMRRIVWEKNLLRIKAHNLLYTLGQTTYTVGMNHLGDYHPHEIKQMLNGYRPELRVFRRRHLLGGEGGGNSETFVVPNDFVAPAALDWRNKTEPAVVTPVKNQGQCGSCWAFSTTGSLEAQHAMKYGKLVSLSEQNLVDCSGKEGNEGCNGGLMDQAFEYIRLNGGIDTEESYPYKAHDEKCKFTNKTIGANDTGFIDIPTQNETALTAALVLAGPVSVAIDASQFGFQFYKSGVYYDASCSSTQLDHGVLAVGFGTLKAANDANERSGKPKPKPKPKNVGDYYIVKNSWGPGWGDKGYIHMSRNRNNNCGIATVASFPKV